MNPESDFELAGLVFKLIKDEKSYKENQGYIDQLFEIYFEAFTEEDEREDKGFIVKRVKKKKRRLTIAEEDPEKPDYDSDTYIFLCILPGENKVAGGLIAEYYPVSKCILLTYIFVDKAYRSKGIGETLINKKLRYELIERELNGQVNAVFLETENPLLTEVEDSKVLDFQDTVRKRFDFFRKIGAKWIDIPYIQPALSEEQQPAKNLFFLTLPQLGRLQYGFKLNKEVLIAFLIEFYNSLIFQASGAEDASKFINDLNYREKSADLYRIVLSIEIADLLEDLDPKGNLEHLEIVNLFALKELLEKEAIKETFDPALIEERINEIRRNLETSGIYADGYLFIRELPRFKKPKIQMGKASICFHIIEDAFAGMNEASPPPRTQPAPENQGDFSYEYCPFFHSFERDLFSLKYHGGYLPFFSKCRDKFKVRVTFCNKLDFISEGRKETCFLDMDDGSPGANGVYQKELECHLNSVHFFNSKVKVWEIIFRPAEGVFLNEFEIIQFNKYFSGKQEKYYPNLKFELIDADKYLGVNKRILGLLSGYRMLFDKYSDPRQQIEEADLDYLKKPMVVKSGTIQIDTKYISQPGKDKGLIFDEEKKILGYFNSILNVSEENSQLGTNDEIWRNIYRFIRLCQVEEAISVIHDFEKIYKRFPIINYVLEAFCGISLGIFDFERMEYEEILDTLTPRAVSATDSSMIFINRAALVKFCHDDTIFASSYHNIGMSPYLIIPSSLLCHNLHLSEKAELIIKQGVSKNDLTVKKIKGLRLLTANIARKSINFKARIRKIVEDYLNIKILPNVFQYPTERDIYEFGMEHWGTKASISEINRLKNNLDSQIAYHTSVRQDIFELRVTIIFLILSFIQIAQTLFEFTTNAKLKITIFVLIIIIAAIFSIVYFYAQKRSYYEHD